MLSRPDRPIRPSDPLLEYLIWLEGMFITAEAQCRGRYSKFARMALRAGVRKIAETDVSRLMASARLLELDVRYIPPTDSQS
jgi:hypothetical protein